MKKILFLLLFPLVGLAQITPLNYWQITGNSPTTNTTYIGTKNNRSLILKTNATQRLKIDTVGHLTLDNSTSRYVFRNFVGGSTPAIYMGASTLTPSGTNYSILQHTGGLFLNDGSGSNVINLLADGNVIFQAVGTKTTGVTSNYAFSPIASSGASSTTAVSNMRVNGGTRGWIGGGTIASQKTNFFTNPTYSATSSSTMIEAFNGYFEKPTASTNMTIQNNFAVGGDGDLGFANNTFYKVKSSDGTYRQIIGMNSSDNIVIQGRQGTTDVSIQPFASTVSIICKGTNGNVGIKNASPSASLDVTGTMSVSSTANFGANVTANRLRIGSSTAPTASLDVTGTGSVSSTFTVNGAFLGQSSITSSSKTGGIGYAVGSGSTVTQATSRTTGVTINAATGSITLVSAAGSTSWQTFTVTNSAVAINDVVVVCQRSGTDLNEIQVTNVAAGSFAISFKTTGGTTTEQPVFNFAVIKGQTN